MSAAAGAPSPFLLLSALHGDPVMAEIWSERSTVQAWLDAEVALAAAQADIGDLEADDAKAIAEAAVLDSIDLNRLWAEARNVGYPILPLVRMVVEGLAPGPDGRVHYGATTQDIMDTGLALQLRAALARVAQLLDRLGDGLATLTEAHRTTVMAARTHAQQAVPTTFGAKTAVFLSECTRHTDRLYRARAAVSVVSLHGAGGTSAALGPRAAEVRQAMAERLGLSHDAVPWHVARDGLAEAGAACVLATATCSRLAREIVDLSRTEIAEAREVGGRHRGASSTMPQKANPISSEAIIGFAVTASALGAALPRAMEAGHERAAGEWQVEWAVLPQLLCATAGALAAAGDVVEGLRVFPEAMRANLDQDQGLVMAEAWMIRLAEVLGREEAHDVVYAAAEESRRTGQPLEGTLPSVLGTRSGRALPHHPAGAPDDYLGLATQACDAAVTAWRTR